MRFGSESPGVALPSPESLPIATQQAPNKPAQQITAEPELPLTTVKEPTLAEDLNDEIPDDFGSEKTESPKASAPPLPNPRRNLKKPAKASAEKPTTRRRPVNPLQAG